MSQHSVIEHRANYFFLKLEEDYIEIFPEEDGHRHCKAAILSILEHWMNAKRTETSCDDDLYTYLSYPQFVKRMFHLYGRNTVIRSLDELVKLRLVLKRPYTDQFNQDTFEYRLNIQAVQTKLQALSDVPVRGSLRINGGSLPINYPSFTDKPGGDLPVNGGSFTDKPNVDTTIDTDVDTSQIPIERAHPSLQRGAINETGDVLEKTLEEVKTASGKHKAVSSCSQGLQEVDDTATQSNQDEQPTVKLPAVQKPGARSLPLVVTPLSGGQGDTSVQAQTSEPVPSQDGAAPAATGGSGPRASGLKIVPARPTVTAKQRDLMPEPKPPTDKQVNDRRAKEIWALIEQKLETTFLTNQRKASKHTKGIEHLIEDQVTDETIEAGLSRLDQWEIDRFSVNRFYELLPGLLAKHRPGANNNTPPAKQGDQEYGVSGLPKLKPLGSVK